MEGKEDETVSQEIRFGKKGGWMEQKERDRARDPRFG